MRALLDVNVLIALLDENHANHGMVSDWFISHVEQGWASCPLTQNGCVRILSQPAYPNPLGTAEAVERLRVAVSTPHHQFVAGDISLLDETAVGQKAACRVPRRLRISTFSRLPLPTAFDL